MGQLVAGEWVPDDVSATGKDGAWERTPTVVREWIRADRSSPHPPAADRYHLWLAWNCTWSQRTMIVRNLLGLEAAIGVSMAHWHRNEGGWWFRDGVDELGLLDHDFSTRVIQTTLGSAGEFLGGLPD